MINLNDLPKIRAHFLKHDTKSRNDPVRCRVLAQLIDIEDLDPRHEIENKFYLCNIRLQNLSAFESLSPSSSACCDIKVRMDERVYTSVFLDQAMSVQTGAACDVNLVAWHNIGQKEIDTDIWEVVDISVLFPSEITEFHDFFITDEGKHFLSLSNPCMPLESSTEE